MEDFTRELFTISKVLRNIPFPRYIIKEYNDVEIVGTFFEDELVNYISAASIVRKNGRTSVIRHFS